jgi:hypothetical protein
VTERIARLLASRWLPLALALVSGLLLLPALWAGFQLDDHFHRFRLLDLGEPSIQLFVFYDGNPERNRVMMELGILPWWTAEQLRHASFRYLSVLTMQLDFLLWAQHVWLMHLHSLVWLGACVAAAALFYRRILGATWVAGLAALLYAVDDAHAMPAAYLANRNALIATCLGVLSLLCFVRWRRDGWGRGAWLSTLLLALALCAGEFGLAAIAYLFAYAVCLERGTLLDRARSLVPSAGVLIVWAVARRVGGFGSEGSGFYVDPLADPLAFAWAFVERAPFLLMGQWTPVPADFGLVTGDAASGLYAFGVVVLTVVAVLLLPLVWRDSTARFFALGSVLSLLPIAAVGPQNRLLQFVGLGSMALLAQLTSGLLTGKPELPGSRWFRIPVGTACALLLLLHVPLATLGGLGALDFHNRSSEAMVRAIASVYTVAAVLTSKWADGLPRPRRLRALSAGSSPLELTRVDSNTLDVRLEHGLLPDALSRYFRSADLPFAVGDRVELSVFSAEVLALNEAGGPDHVRYRFQQPLEHSAHRWLCWDDGVYVDCSPPAIGGSIAFSGPVGIFGW